MQIELSSDASAIIARFQGISERSAENVRAAIARELLVLQSAFLMNPGVKLSGSRSGLASRLTSYSRIVGGDIDAAIGFRKTRHFPYELSQEFGATARPGGAMAIPVGKKAKAMSARGLSPKDWPRGMLNLVKTMGRAYLVSEQGRSSARRSDLEYVLVKSIKPRMRFLKTIHGGSEGISNAISEAWRK